MRLFIGTYTEKTESAGIYSARFDSEKSVFSVTSVTESENPSFLAKSGAHLYAAGEVAGTGRLTHYLAGEDGSLSVRDSAEFPGAACCHAAVHPLGHAVYAANYGSGNIAAFSLGRDGSVGRRLSLIDFEGNGPNRRRQQSPHAHSVNIDGGGKHLVAADLGTDRLMVYDVASDGSLSPNEVNAYVSLAPGEGPRHMVFHPRNGCLYAVTELKNNIYTFGYDSVTGALSEKQITPLLPARFGGDNIGADIHLSPDGRFLCASSRGWDGIAVFAVGPDGLLSDARYFDGAGRTPRNFAISPGGEFIFIAYQDSGLITASKIDAETGGIMLVSAELRIPSPVCVIAERG